jgi:hypothetical protein
VQGGEFANHTETIILHRNLVNYEVCATICLTKPSKTEQNPRKTRGFRNHRSDQTPQNLVPGTICTDTSFQPEAPRGFPEAPRGSQWLPEASQRLPEAPRGSQRLPEASQRLLGAPGAGFPDFVGCSKRVISTTKLLRKVPFLGLSWGGGTRGPQSPKTRSFWQCAFRPLKNTVFVTSETRQTR